jgi:hypothetical protein
MGYQLKIHFRSIHFDWKTFILTVAISLLTVTPFAALGFFRSETFLLRTNSRDWLYVWFPTGFLIATNELIRGRFLSGGSAIAFAFLMYLVCKSFCAPRKLIILGFFLNLILVLIATQVQRGIEAESWWGLNPAKIYPSGMFGVSQLSGGGIPAFRSWLQPAGSAGIGLEFQARVTGLSQNWSWEPSQPGFGLQDRLESGHVLTRVVFPRGADPYLFIALDTGRHISGQVFRVSLEMRAKQPIPARGCRGIWLQEDGRAYAAKCLPVALSPSWKNFSLIWQAPPVKDSPTGLRVVLNDFDGLEFDVRRIKVERAVSGTSGWISLLRPWIGLRRSGQKVASGRVYLENGSDWRSYRLIEAGLATNQVEVQAIAWPGESNIELRNVSLLGRDGAANPIVKSPSSRISLWFPSPNLLGHVVLVLGLSVMALTRRPSWAVLAFVLTLLALLPSGSRTAWLAFVIGGVWLLWLVVYQYNRIALITILALFVLVLIGGGLNRVSVIKFDASLEDGNLVSRPEIWSIGWQTLLERPFGLGESGFKTRFHQRRPEVPNINHAHNFWLEMAVRYGWVGLFVAVVFSAALLFLSWRWGRFRGLVLVSSVLLMNVFDYTLFFPGVAYPLFLSLNALREELRSKSLARNVVWERCIVRSG